MWTIAYEFRCYLFFAALGGLGFLQRPRMLLVLTAVMMTSFILTGLPTVSNALIRANENSFATFFIMYPPDMIRLFTAFLVGACFYLYRESAIIKLNTRTAILGILVTILALSGNTIISEAGFLVGGSTVLFWLCFQLSIGALQRINESWDISYGTYLYGWPVATTLIWMQPQISPWAVACIALPIAWCIGAASWWGIEKPILSWGRLHLSASLTS
jgi:peptidoglycan/LPS O-acetylase OafA/YrhL